MEDFFVFNNLNSLDLDIVIEEGNMPPITNSQNEIEELPVPGRDGVLTIDTQRRKQVYKEITCILLEEDNKHIVRSSLRGVGRLLLSNEEGVFYKCRVSESVEFKDHWNGGWEFTVKFLCHPFSYLISGDNVINVITKGTVIYNEHEDSRPLIRVYGSGEVDLIINNDISKLNIDGYAEIDSELQESYKDLIPVPINTEWRKMKLKSGENIINWNGNISKVEVVPRWRK